MAEHELKTQPPCFADVVAGWKPFEVRLNDRDYRVGDTLWLREWIPTVGGDGLVSLTEGTYTGRDTRVKVIYLMPGTAGPGVGIRGGYAVMGIVPLHLPVLALPAHAIEAIRQAHHLARQAGQPTTSVPTSALAMLVAGADGLHAQLSDAVRLTWQQGQLLTQAVNALRGGDPGPQVMYSHHDAPELAAAAAAERDRLRAFVTTLAGQHDGVHWCVGQAWASADAAKGACRVRRACLEALNRPDTAAAPAASGEAIDGPLPQTVDQVAAAVHAHDCGCPPDHPGHAEHLILNQVWVATVLGCAHGIGYRLVTDPQWTDPAVSVREQHHCTDECGYDLRHDLAGHSWYPVDAPSDEHDTAVAALAQAMQETDGTPAEVGRWLAEHDWRLTPDGTRA